VVPAMKHKARPAMPPSAHTGAAQGGAAAGAGGAGGRMSTGEMAAMFAASVASQPEQMGAGHDSYGLEDAEAAAAALGAEDGVPQASAGAGAAYGAFARGGAPAPRPQGRPPKAKRAAAAAGLRQPVTELIQQLNSRVCMRLLRAWRVLCVVCCVVRWCGVAGLVRVHWHGCARVRARVRVRVCVCSPPSDATCHHVRVLPPRTPRADHHTDRAGADHKRAHARLAADGAQGCGQEGQRQLLQQARQGHVCCRGECRGPLWGGGGGGGLWWGGGGAGGQLRFVASVEGGRWGVAARERQHTQTCTHTHTHTHTATRMPCARAGRCRLPGRD
jgi:hypothetical protein